MTRSHALTALASLAIGAVVGAWLWGADAPPRTDAPASTQTATARGASASPQTQACPPCPECPSDAALRAAPTEAGQRSVGGMRALAAAAKARREADRRARWPQTYPERFAPEVVKAAVAEAKRTCGELIPETTTVHCQGFPCAIELPPRKNGGAAERLDWHSCPALKALGTLHASSRTRDGVRRTVAYQSTHGTDAEAFEQLNGPWRSGLLESEGSSQRNCELEGDAAACGLWAKELAATDLPAALATAQTACEDGSAMACRVLGFVGGEALPSFQKACELGDNEGCIATVGALCHDRDDATCGDAALAAAQRNLELLSEREAYTWLIRQAEKTLGKVYCQLGQLDKGLELITSGCRKLSGSDALNCDPQAVCDRPHFFRPRL